MIEKNQITPLTAINFHKMAAQLARLTMTIR